MTFDNNGEITKIFGNPILVTADIPQTKDVSNKIEKFATIIQKKYATIIGKTKVTLVGSGKICHIEECNLGNLAADAMVDYVRNLLFIVIKNL